MDAFRDIIYEFLMLVKGCGSDSDPLMIQQASNGPPDINGIKSITCWVFFFSIRASV